MKSTLVLGALLTSVAIGQPHKQHHARHHKRANAESLVIVTDWVTEYETVGVTETVWVSSGFVPPTQVTTTSTSPSTAKEFSSTSQSPAQFLESASSSTSSAPTSTATSTPASTSTSSSSTSVSTPSPVYVAPTSSSVYVAPAESHTSVAAVVVPTTTAAAVVYKPTSTSAAPVATSTTASSGSTSGVCSSGSPCTGDITYYEAGLGACGETTDGSIERVVALPHGLMGTLSNDNPYCGKTITIESGGKTTTATVVDKCMGCAGDSIDLSNAAFLELAELAVGRTTATWYFN